MRKQSGAGRRRSEQFKRALDAGFSRQEARRIRDFDTARFDRTITAKRAPAEPIPRRERGFLAPERRQHRISEREQRGIERETRAPVLSRVLARADEWSTWNRDRNYPSDIERRARRINESVDLDPNDSFGWRVMYRKYVHGDDIPDDLDALKDSDSGAIARVMAAR